MAKLASAEQQFYEQKIEYARGSLWLPFHTVGMAACIRGKVPEEPARAVLHKLAILYPPLASRVRSEGDGTAWLTTNGAQTFELEVRPRQSDRDLETLFLEQERIPFDFLHGPLARFFLLRGEHQSELVAIAPHVICDGYAMTYVMEDAVTLLNDPNRMVNKPLPPPAFSWKTVQHARHDHILLRAGIWIFSRLWPGRRTPVNQEMYEQIHHSYWAGRRQGMLRFELSPVETAKVVARCRQRGISITGALLAAFLLARDPELTSHCDVTVAVNIRARMLQPPGRAVGVYASNMNLLLHPKPGIRFWELARQAHGRIHKVLDDRPALLLPLALGELDPLINDGLVAALASGRWEREFGMLTRFIRIGGVSADLDISNIGRIDLPDVGKAYPLQNIIPLPPLGPAGGLALNVLTVDGRMNAILKFREDQVDAAKVAVIKERALSHLLEAQ